MVRNLKILFFLLAFLSLGWGIFYLTKTYTNKSLLTQTSNLANLKKILENEILSLKEKIFFLEEKLNETLMEIESLKKIEVENFKVKKAEKERENLEKKEEIKICEKFDQKPKLKVIFNEICWMGDEDSPANEWIELKNVSSEEIDLDGWQILNKNQKIKIVFEKGEKISPGGYLLLTRGDDFSGAIKNSNEGLYLFDSNCNLQDKVEASSTWPAGDLKTKKTAERKDDFSWQTSKESKGTPGKENSKGSDFEEKKEEFEPKISLDLPPKIFSQKEFEVLFSISGLKESEYDLKISILKISKEAEKDRTISEISLTGEEWQDSYKYLTNFFSGNSFSGKIKLRVSQDFSGEAEILLKVRENSNKKIVGELSKKIYIEKFPQETQKEQKLFPIESSFKILINEVQIAGQTADDEFIELFNLSDQTIDLENWRLTRKTSSGSEYTILSNQTKVKFSGKIPARGFFLIAHPDSSFSSIANLVHSGTQSLAKDNTLILYNPSGEIVDKIGWGKVKDCEGSPFPQNPEPNQSLERINFQDTDDNSKDFQVNSSPTPGK